MQKVLSVTRSTKKPLIKRNSPLYKITKQYQLYLLLLPALVYIIIFKYLPMWGIQMAFRDYQVNKGFFNSNWVGVKHFISFFKSPVFERLIVNTVGLSLINLLFTFSIPIIISLMLNEVRNRYFKKTVQMTLYAPYFVSTVIVATMIYQLLSNFGFVNNVLAAMGLERVSFLADPNFFKPIYVISEVWQGAGYGTVIYLAVLSGVDLSLYDAVKIDGASILQKIRYVDIPCILPTASILLILGMGGILNVGFEKVYLLSNDMNISKADVISTYVYRTGLAGAQFSYAAAIGLFNSVISLIMLMLVNSITRKLSETSLF